MTVANLRPMEMGYQVRVAPDLVPMVRPLGQFTVHPDNFRDHDLPAIAESLQDFGQQTPIVAQRSTGYICKGNGTFLALCSLGSESAAVSVEDFDDVTALKYLIADNKASDRSRYLRDRAVLALRKLEDLHGTLWDLDELEDLEAELGAVEVLDHDFTGGYAEAPEGLAARADRAGQQGTKMREIPVVLGIEEHAAFMRRLALLRPVYGTTGHIATIVEAVRRAAEAL